MSSGDIPTAETQIVGQEQEPVDVVSEELSPGLVFILGPPGAGKETLSKHLVSEYNFKHISYGDVLRKVKEMTSDQATQAYKITALEFKQVAEYKSGNESLPGELAAKLLRQEIFAQGVSTKCWIIDGFPRSDDHWKEFRKLYHITQERRERILVLVMNCAEEIAKKRCLKRDRKGDKENFGIRYLKYYDNINKILPIMGKEEGDHLMVVEIKDEENLDHASEVRETALNRPKGTREWETILKIVGGNTS
ncbi:P-loop containing nucleoside triphosphate hydrolase protein [Lindgomyces ingoldianus]|uniref:P-loop containing nucleoside triphosphate hydrolase protein n=1 Tax=Lindgomyces ingoldianus TaxID=673940 RepID=A0ACB6QD49_9PLEO|nr:P-loop containing nucleoside triphosphate hydrolase protein [Lindgomyces ingoldianus]KAF2464883.1 P-loop containing nucleoside triphosphate hydrolase protein [Lindgomyces ingoldianus]